MDYKGWDFSEHVASAQNLGCGPAESSAKVGTPSRPGLAPILHGVLSAWDSMPIEAPGAREVLTRPSTAKTFWSSQALLKRTARQSYRLPESYQRGHWRTTPFPPSNLEPCPWPRGTEAADYPVPHPKEPHYPEAMPEFC